MKVTSCRVSSLIVIGGVLVLLAGLGTALAQAGPPLSDRSAPVLADAAPAALPREGSAASQVLAGGVLIIQDQDPWGYSAIQDILTAHSIAYDQVDSSEIPTVNLTPYGLVIIPSNQPGSFYTTWNANIARFETFVSAGGALWLSTCAYSATAPEPLVPGGVVNATDLDDFNVIVAPAHPWVAGVPSPMEGDFASHDSFTNLFPGSVVVAQAQGSGLPTLVEYAMGTGRILITGQTLEITWEQGWDGAPILENSLLDMVDWASQQAPEAIPATGVVGLALLLVLLVGGGLVALRRL